jgi:hypothetical protein
MQQRADRNACFHNAFLFYPPAHVIFQALFSTKCMAAAAKGFEEKMELFGSERFWRLGEAERRSMPVAACD